MTKDIAQLQREWHNKIAELQKTGQAMAEAQGDQFADPFTRLQWHIFQIDSAVQHFDQEFTKSFKKPLP